MPAAAHPTHPSAAPARSPWFHSARFDLLLLLGVPFLTWPLITAAQFAWGPALLAQLILLTATGHYFATFVRTYGDRELFARFRLRFVLAPVILLATSLTLIGSGHLPALLLVTTAWAFWHWLAQAFGFARIYDIKVGSFRPLTVWLDKALVIVGFVSALTLNDGAVAEIAKVFVGAGIALPTAAWFAVVQSVVLVAVVAIAAAYVGNLTWTIVRRQPWSWQKQVMHVTTIGYYWFAFAWLPNVLVAYVLYELFHDIQYYAITWLTCRQRVRRPGTTAWLQRLFRPGWAAALTFVLLMTAFGALDLGGRQLDAATPLHQLSLAVFLTAALLHYYYDGFIWKARESALGGDLGIAGGLRAAMVPGLRHGMRWALFALPLAAVPAWGGRTTGAREQAAALVALAPGDFGSQADYALLLAKARELPAALAHYRASIAANPDFAQSRLNYGAALDLAGDLDGAREQYERALRCRDSGEAHRQAHIDLGVVLLLRGETAAAQQHFDIGMRMGVAEHPISRLLGLAAAVPTEAVERRLQLYRAILQLEPDQPDACLNLGNLLLVQRRFDGAADCFTAVLRRLPDCVPALVGLAAAQAGLGRTEQARDIVQAALQREPGNAQAVALRQRLQPR